MKLIMPMAGAGKRFLPYSDTPKPFIEIDGLPLFIHVLKNSDIDTVDEYIIGVREEHQALFEKYAHLIPKKHQVIYFDQLTAGPAITVRNLIWRAGVKDSFLISNCDQFSDYNKTLLKITLHDEKWDGVILTFQSESLKNSYVEVKDGRVIKCAEKQLISNTATTGVYYWKNPQDYLDAVEAATVTKDHYNNEYYVCPLYNHVRPDFITLPFEVNQHYPLGVPEDLEAYKHVLYN